MGQWDVPIIGGVLLIGGYFVITNPDLFANLFPEPEPTNGNGNGGEIVEDDEEEDGNGNGGGGGSTDCKKACTNCWCESYSKNCSGSCSGCKGGNRVGKCSPGSGSGGSTTSSSKSEDCKKFCNKGWCESYRKRGCTGGCVTCIKGGIASPSGSGCPAKVISSNCAGNCRSTCWHGRSGSIVRDVCVSKSISGCNSVSCSACQAARSAFLKKYSSNLAYAYPTYPYNAQAMRMSIA